MKAGDKTPVNIGAHTVAQAEVKEVNIEDGTVTLVVPATLVVMGIRTDFTDLPNTGGTSDTETIITGVQGPEGPVEPVEEAPPVVESPPVVTPANPGVTDGSVAAPETPPVEPAPVVVETPEVPPAVETPAAEVVNE